MSLKTGFSSTSLLDKSQFSAKTNSMYVLKRLQLFSFRLIDISELIRFSSLSWENQRPEHMYKRLWLTVLTFWWYYYVNCLPYDQVKQQAFDWRWYFSNACFEHQHLIQIPLSSNSSCLELLWKMKSKNQRSNCVIWFDLHTYMISKEEEAEPGSKRVCYVLAAWNPLSIFEGFSNRYQAFL